MKKKINTRLIGIALIAILVTLVGVTSIYYYLFENQVKKDLHVLTDTLVDSGVFNKNEIENISFTSEDVRITWIDLEGTVLYDSWTNAKEMENHLQRPEIKEAFEKGMGDSVRHPIPFKEIPTIMPFELREALWFELRLMLAVEQIFF